MGVILLDTSILVDNLRGDADAGQALDAAVSNGHEFVASVLTKVELLAGMRSHERKATRALLDSMAWIDVDDEISERAGEMARKLRASHRGVGVVDYVIAATTSYVGATLWTRNLKHFPMFPGLSPPY